ncbi:MAG: hypothetical protein C4586_05700 [Anaerolineaceae bacterium]|nr:MAG: hypothetical protein C4586_05700 [Anaerolineaceae bacterium]
MQLLFDDRFQVTGFEVDEKLNVLISVENWNGIGIDWDFASLTGEEQRWLISEVRARDPELASKLAEEWLV